jgi:uncharacterized membrane protein (UPF0136 family)
VSYIILALRALAKVAGIPTGCAHFIGNRLGKAQILSTSKSTEGVAIARSVSLNLIASLGGCMSRSRWLIRLYVCCRCCSSRLYYLNSNFPPIHRSTYFTNSWEDRFSWPQCARESFPSLDRSYNPFSRYAAPSTVSAPTKSSAESFYYPTRISAFEIYELVDCCLLDALVLAVTTANKNSGTFEFTSTCQESVSLLRHSS